MKTIFNAVNELMGRLENAQLGLVKTHSVLISKISGELYNSESFDFTDGWRLVCSHKEFNALVSALENWQPTLSVSPLADLTYSKYKEKLMSESKPKLVTVNSMQYEIDKAYDFSQYEDFRDYSKLNLTGIDENDGMFETEHSFWSHCRVSRNLILGTITPAPVELVDGAAYEFESKFGKYCGFYLKCGERFTIHPDGTYVLRSDTLRITRLVPEVKS
jgi:hypothetical protein